MDQSFQSLIGQHSNSWNSNHWGGNTYTMGVGGITHQWGGDVDGLGRQRKNWRAEVTERKPKNDWRAEVTEGKPKTILDKKWRRKRQNRRKLPKDISVCQAGNWIVPYSSFAYPPPPIPTYHGPSGFSEPPPGFSEQPTSLSEPTPTIISEPEVLDVFSLLNQLQQNGLIGLAAKKSKIPEITLEKSSLRTRYPEVVSQLYQDKALQCKTCAERFSVDDKSQYGSHLDWHFMKNQSKKGVREAKSRSWYSNGWEEDAATDVLDVKKSDTEEEVQEKAVAVGEGEEGYRCPKCLEGFELFYSEDEEEKSKDDYSLWSDELSKDGQWYFRKAVRINEEIYHQQCIRSSSS